jgi:hypothetical protein
MTSNVLLNRSRTPEGRPKASHTPKLFPRKNSSRCEALIVRTTRSGSSCLCGVKASPARAAFLMRPAQGAATGTASTSLLAAFGFWDRRLPRLRNRLHRRFWDGQDRSIRRIPVPEPQSPSAVSPFNAASSAAATHRAGTVQRVLPPHRRDSVVIPFPRSAPRLSAAQRRLTSLGPLKSAHRTVPALNCDHAHEQHCRTHRVHT